MRFRALVGLLALACNVAAIGPPVPGITQFRLNKSKAPSGDDNAEAQAYPAQTISTPVDHFHNESMYEPHTNAKYNMRYWFDASYYKPGGPVIVLMSGEADGTERLPFLQKGIVAQLAEATHGIGVVLEHRYYGDSWPTADLSTKNLRFLTTEQALADTTYFAQNVKFKGLEHLNLTAPHTPYIAYGGSYAGAFAAFLRTEYPETWFGAISSSGVTVAQYDYWQYFEPIRQYAPQACIDKQVKLTNVFDNIMLKNKTFTSQLKQAFGLSGLKYDDDFGNLLSYPLGDWQGRNWDPAINDPAFAWYCGNLTSSTVTYKNTQHLKPTVQKLLAAGGYGNQVDKLTTPFLNMIGYINDTYVAPCVEQGQSEYSCFSTRNLTYYKDTSIATGNWRSWPYQYCTEYGYIQSGGQVPKNKLPLLSRTVTLDYLTIVCRAAFGINHAPDVQRVNKWGGFNIAAKRLAIIGGEADPWRPVTPMADNAKNRTSTTDQPFLLIPGGVHHWDENGVFKNETTASIPPPQIRKVQSQMRDFVLAWMKEWKGGKY